MKMAARVHKRLSKLQYGVLIRAAYLEDIEIDLVFEE
jgi:hypothetical protein